MLDLMYSDAGNLFVNPRVVLLSMLGTIQICFGYEQLGPIVIGARLSTDVLKPDSKEQSHRDDLCTCITFVQCRNVL
jgi:hypothetical protein